MSRERSGPEVDSRAPITIEQAKAGTWVTPPVNYVNPERRFCAMTGRPLARRYWRVMAGEQELAFSDPEQAARYATYPTRVEHC